jgi:hypothetical protein
MKRLAVLCVFVGVSLAAAATLKMKFFYYTTGPDQDGVATLHYVPGENGGNGPTTKIHVTITGFTPNTPYGVCVDDGLVDSGVANGITTNSGGNGEVNLWTGGDFTFTSRTVKIYVDKNGDGYYTPFDPNAPAPLEEVATGTAE